MLRLEVAFSCDKQPETLHLGGTSHPAAHDSPHFDSATNSPPAVSHAQCRGCRLAGAKLPGQPSLAWTCHSWREQGFLCLMANFSNFGEKFDVVLCRWFIKVKSWDREYKYRLSRCRKTSAGTAKSG